MKTGITKIGYAPITFGTGTITFGTPVYLADAQAGAREYSAEPKGDLHTPESVKFKLPSKAERLINTAFSPKVLMFEFAPNGCRKTYIIKCLKHLISCEVQALFINRVSRIQDTV